ncbi:odorant receptor 30a-like [Phthorimaea operculella]|nr:odorant receptor 30a-like [Phthorimaea operculella]
MQSIIKYFVKEKKKDDEEVNEKDLSQDPAEKEFKSFPETYRIITFALSFGLMYPNPATRWFRFIGISVMLGTAIPLAVFILIDIYKCWLRKDIFEIIRHSTIVGPFLGGFLKQYFMVIFQDPANAIINEINRDYELYNRLEEDYKTIVRAHVNNCLVNSEKWWTVTVLTCVMIFPIMAATFTLYSFLFSDMPQKYMVHELNKPWDKDPEARFESPYYEIANFYMLYACCFYMLNFLGYDGFYGLAINHAVLKMQMYCKALQDAMQYEGKKVYERVVGVIYEQNRTFRASRCGVGRATNHAGLKMQMYCKALQDAMQYEGKEVYERVVGVIYEQNRTFRPLDA